jgi:hypothetical protein
MRKLLTVALLLVVSEAKAEDRFDDYRVRPPRPVYEDSFTTEQQRREFRRDYDRYYQDQTYGRAIRGED